MSADTSLLTPAPPHPPRTRSRLLGWAVLALLGALFAQVLLEGYVQQRGGHWGRSTLGSAEYLLAEWPKTLKTTLYLALAVAALAKIAVERRWRDFTTRADLALAVLVAVMVVAGLAGGSHGVLIGEALFVYFRGVIVFVAWRALDPSRRQIRLTLWALGAFVGLSAAIATVQSVLGKPTYGWLGWTDLTWANLNRAHALFNHPNHLGHVLGLALLGLLAWFVSRDRVPRRWWAAFALLAFGLSATQSRESTVGFVLGALVILVLRRRVAWKATAVAVVLVLGFAVLQLAVSPANRSVLLQRLAGVTASFDQRPGTEPDGFCVRGDPGCDPARAVERREIRALFAYQGVDLWLQRPVLGYGVGQFGGIVAYKDDPQWAEKLGFNLYGAKPDQVDSFWLHLLVETGVLGVLAYFAWLWFLVAPMVRSRVRDPFLAWGPAVVVFSGFVALLSPSLEDPLYPPLLFTVLGLGWVALRRTREHAETE